MGIVHHTTLGQAPKVIETTISSSETELIPINAGGGQQSFIGIEDPDIQSDREIEVYAQSEVNHWHMLFYGQDNRGTIIGDGYILVTEFYADTPLRVFVTWYEQETFDVIS